MKLMIHQPYFCPYLGYWQQINACNVFILHNTQYMKNGFVNRNRLWNTVKQDWEWFTIPVKKFNSVDNISAISVNLEQWILTKPWHKLQLTYGKLNNYETIINLVFPEGIKNLSENLGKNIERSIINIAKYLEIPTQIQYSEDFGMEDKRSTDKVLSLCKEFKDVNYINASGGRELYFPTEFEEHNIKLNFFKPCLPSYNDEKGNIIPQGLSILDVLMRNSRDQVIEWIKLGEIID